MPILTSIVIEPLALPGHGPPPSAGLRELRRAYPALAIRTGRADAACAVPIDAVAWAAPGFDPLSADARLAAALAGAEERRTFDLHIGGALDPASSLRVALQAATRYQRFMDARNEASACALFDQVLALHRRLHDPARPLVAADFDHTRDTWRWVLRLQPRARLAVQVAALFHDIERLDSESEVRVEHRQPDYLAFKTRHAAGGAAVVQRLLSGLDAPRTLVEQVAELVRGHEQPAGDPELQLLNEADALSFFSLNACGFAAYYDAAHTRRKVAFTLGRLGPRGWRELGRIRHRADFQSLIDQLAPAAGRGSTPAPLVERHP